MIAAAPVGFPLGVTLLARLILQLWSLHFFSVFFFLPSLFPLYLLVLRPNKRSDWLPRFCSSSGTGLSSRRSAPPPSCSWSLLHHSLCSTILLLYSYSYLCVLPVGEHLAWTLPLVRASIGCDWRAPASSVWPQILTRIFTRLCFCIFFSSSHLSPLIAPFVSPSFRPVLSSTSFSIRLLQVRTTRFHPLYTSSTLMRVPFTEAGNELVNSPSGLFSRNIHRLGWIP